MGWKAFNLIATTRDDGYLAEFPKPSHQKAREYLALLGGAYKYKREATFEEGLYPQDPSDLYVGVYDHAIVLGSLPITEEAFTGKLPRAVECATTVLPGCRVLVVMLHSVVDMYGFAWYEGGRLIRARAGNADDGVFFEKGVALPIEENLKSFDKTIDGEELIMELCRPFLGCRIDEYNAWDLKMELFRQNRTRFAKVGEAMKKMLRVPNKLFKA